MPPSPRSAAQRLSDARKLAASLADDWLTRAGATIPADAQDELRFVIAEAVGVGFYAAPPPLRTAAAPHLPRLRPIAVPVDADAQWWRRLLRRCHHLG